MSRNKNNSDSGMMFRTIVDQSLMGIVIIQDDVIKYVNQKFSDLLQYSAEEMMSWGQKEFYKVVSPETIELVKEQSLLKQKGLPGAIEYLTGQLKKKSGDLFWVEIFSKTVMYEGRPANYVTIIDIAKRVEAEQNLKESEKKFKILFNNSTSGIAYHKIVYDSDGNPIDYIIIDVNPQFYEILPFKREDVINKRATKAYKVEQAPYLDIYSEVTKIQKSTSFETYFPPIDRHFKISVISPEKGKFITVFDDISERKKAEQKLKESEEKYRLLFENMNAGFAYHKVITGKNSKPIDYKFLEVNPMYEELTGLKASDMIGKTVTEILPGTENDPADWIGKFGTVGLTGVPLTVEDYSEAIDRWYNVSGYSPKKGYFAVTFNDITERKKAEEKLVISELKYRKAYEQANFYKDLFTHDISNIIQVINSSSELISYQFDETEKSKVIEKLTTLIREQVKRAKKLVQNITVLSDLEETHQQNKLIEVCDLLRNSITFITNSFPGREINLKIESLNRRISVQANELLQDVFENILTNAVKYNDKNTVELEIKISEVLKEGKNYFKFEFRDNGIGVADDRKAIIFEKGNRKFKGRKGMGLGLSLVKKIVTSYESEIWVEDRVSGDHHQGSNFIFLIPQ